MKIAHVVPYKLDPFSGVYTSITGICAGLARAGHDVELWSLSPWPAQGLEMAAELDEAALGRLEDVVLGLETQLIVTSLDPDRTLFAPARTFHVKQGKLRRML